jgi:hypothetical protein
MTHITVIKPFKFAHRGIDVEEFEPAKEPRETTDECAALAVAEGWAKRAKTPEENKAHPAAPETKADASADPPPAA